MAGDNSLAAWLEMVLEERYCLDCEREIAGLAEPLEFGSISPHAECIGSLCLPCAEWREELRRLKTP